MRRTDCGWLFALFILTLTSLQTAGAEQDPVESRRTISVTGQAEIGLPPDTMSVSFAVETTAPKASGAAAENATKSAAVATALERLLGEGEAVTTTRYTLEPRYAQQHPGETTEPRITGYVARNEVRVESRKIDQAGALLDAATAAGANRISGLSFYLSKRDEAVRQALEQAGADAHSQAESVAKGLGVRVKRVLSASTSTAPVPIPHRYGTAALAADVRAPTRIEAGDVKVAVSLHVSYEIE